MLCARVTRGMRSSAKLMTPRSAACRTPSGKPERVRYPDDHVARVRPIDVVAAVLRVHAGGSHLRDDGRTEHVRARPDRAPERCRTRRKSLHAHPRCAPRRHPCPRRTVGASRTAPVPGVRLSRERLCRHSHDEASHLQSPASSQGVSDPRVGGSKFPRPSRASLSCFRRSGPQTQASPRTIRASRRPHPEHRESACSRIGIGSTIVLPPSSSARSSVPTRLSTPT